MHIIALRRRKGILTKPVRCMYVCILLPLDHLPPYVVSLVRYAMSGRRGEVGFCVIGA